MYPVTVLFHVLGQLLVFLSDLARTLTLLPRPVFRTSTVVVKAFTTTVSDIIAKMRLALFGHAHTYMYIHTNLYSGKNRENESEALAQDD